ncbi:hypothetical protein B0H65DRAFT_575607 [Neurospora tetraspora]|uniref:G-patch domain-containing protein n=1 Tax=Neurospora tetraspora TaxID=94610 RepID=A0AAE0JC18_9PEZI|nr:hypothetical protein B0H65DRAFT_575607 [Neurospora tetraspora]
MSYKRSRATFEADLTAQQSPYVFFGTPLPPRDPEVRDDGSYVPIWKQEVRDERGRKRLHGAFTGGFSAGYFNTVGSKEGWTPSTFVSSRTNRHKDAPKAVQQRPEDFMDEEDLADAEEAKKIQTNAAFAGLGSTANDATRASSLMGLFRTQGETMGVKLLKKMGWREGQGIGPKVRRKARLELQNDATAQGGTFLFAPENVPMIAFVKKTDRKGLGYAGESRLTPIGLSGSKKSSHGDTDDEDEDDYGSLGRPKLTIGGARKKETNKVRGGIGIGVLNDTGSDDEDPYEVGPKISYNRVIGGDKKKKKATIAANPTLQAKPKFITKKAASSILGKVGLGVRKCHDGRLPLDGFVFGKEPDALTTETNSEGKYPPPQIPPGWVSSRTPKPESGGSPAANYVSTADVAKASTLDPKARAALLGEKQLPGKSVFDFISPASRDRLAAVTGRSDLPQAFGEVPAAYARSEAEKQQELLDRVPKLDKETAIAAISRGIGGGAPYAEDEEKRARYRGYLEFQAGFRPQLPPKPKKLTDEEWLREFHEFFNCARIFKPMTGFMASRFTTSSSTKAATSTTGDKDSLVSKPPPKPEDPAEEAARLGMFGTMTRSTTDFYPTRLLCKRFGVKPPAHVQPDNYDATSAVERELLGLEFGSTGGGGGGGSTAMADLERGGGEAQKPAAAVLDTSRNEALEGKRPGDEVFKAIFGDNSSCSSSGPIFDHPPHHHRASRLSLPKRRSAEEDTGLLSDLDLDLNLDNLALDHHHLNHLSDDNNTIPETLPPGLVCFTAEVNGFRRPTTTTAVAGPEPPSASRSPPPQYPASESSSAGRPPPFSSLFASPSADPELASSASVFEPFDGKYAAVSVTDFDNNDVVNDQDELNEVASSPSAAPAYAPSDPFVVHHPSGVGSSSSAFVATAPSTSSPGFQFQDETKRALSQKEDTKGESSRKEEEAEPPPAYSEGSSPLQSFTYLMAAAGGASSIITQVQQGGPPINTLGDVAADETITIDLRGTRFTLSRDELLTLPEFVLLSLFPNGLFPEGHMGGFGEGDAVQVDYDPASLQYMLEFFRTVAQSIPVDPSNPQDGSDGIVPLDPASGARGDDGSKRAGIIVLREDLDFYAIPPRADLGQAEMMEIKRAAARALLKQDGIFSGLKKSDEPGTTEAHLIEMLTAGGFNYDDRWGHRAGEPNKAVICSLALARLRSDIKGNEMGSNAVGMAQKLLLFWRKPARRCWWEGVELEGVEGLEPGTKLKVWIRRVWTLEMSVIGLR